MSRVSRTATAANKIHLGELAFRNHHAAWLWLLVRLYLAQIWLTSAYAKLTSDAWTGNTAGSALTGFIQGALAKVGGPHPDVQAWYAWFLGNIVLPNATAWSYMISIGELLVGLGLLFGALTGLAAFAGAFMNLNFLLAGTVSMNPTMFVLEILLVIAWRVAGLIGLDRWIEEDVSPAVATAKRVPVKIRTASKRHTVTRRRTSAGIPAASAAPAATSDGL